MPSENIRILLFVAWAVAVGLAAYWIGIASVPYWVVAASVAVVPPVVAWTYWRTPEQTMSQAINSARR